MLVTPRAAFALAADGQLPAWFGRVSARFATPANSIVFLGALACLLALTGSFVALAVVSTLARLWVYVASLAALPVIRRKRGLPPRRGAARLLSPAILAGGLAFCLWAIAQSSAKSWATFGALLLVGGALYAVARLARATGPS
jgi:amino acid transporter